MKNTIERDKETQRQLVYRKESKFILAGYINNKFCSSYSINEDLKDSSTESLFILK